MGDWYDTLFWSEPRPLRDSDRALLAGAGLPAEHPGWTRAAACVQRTVWNASQEREEVLTESYEGQRYRNEELGLAYYSTLSRDPEEPDQLRPVGDTSDREIFYRIYQSWMARYR